MIDQYRVTEDTRSGIVSDPNREDDEQYILRLVCQVVQVSVETVKIVEGLPTEFAQCKRSAARPLHSFIHPYHVPDTDLGANADGALMGIDPAATTDLKKLHDNVASVVLGKPEVIRLSLVALLADGHLLLEDVPGVGKTLLAKAIARSIDCTFRRVQFTPDLLPADLLGTSVFHQPSGEFRFLPGPLFAQVVLADEVNRATPRTQSALLEAMGERQVSMDGITHRLGPPFFVVATQNPYEFEGTYPLPESQLDRFLLRTDMGYPDRQAERDLLRQHRDGEPVDHLQPVLHASDITRLQERVREVKVTDAISDYVLDIVEATRVRGDIVLGASTRAAIGLYRAAQAIALLDGRDYVVPDDVKGLAVQALAHRLIGKAGGIGAPTQATADAVREILREIPVPS